MKKLWTFTGIIAIGAAGAWYFQDALPSYLRIPSVKQLAAAAGFGSIPGDSSAAASKGDGGEQAQGQRRKGEQAAGQGGEQAQNQGQGQGGGKPAGQGRRGGGPSVVKTIPATTGILALDVAATGWAEADETTTIAALQQGLVVSVAAKDGDEVKAGTLIAKLDDRTAAATVAKDKANIVSDEASLAELEAALQRAENLLKQNVQSQQSFEQAKGARDQAAAKVDADRATLVVDEVALEHTDIRAPFDGRLGDIAVSQGAYVSAGATIVTITRYDPISVAFQLPQRYLPQLRVGIDTGAAVDADPAATGGVVDSGKLIFFDNAVNQSSGTVLVKAQFKNDKGLLWPGQSVNVTAHFTPSDRSIIVPTVAVRPGADGSFVYTVDGTGKVHATPVTVIRANGDKTAIAEGLRDGDHVVVEGQVQLANGQSVIEQFSGDDANRPLPVADATSMTGGIKP
ncbi:efflux RND transporter periplasmic adaptor subunit [Rhizobium sp. SGZ-381]|uniref:efflux RND transporter periplasmic adaptor subunit n=1 Tax=Rhizobium sp. SGZ-381 TaxID=3342800 RepID=UPI00366E6B7F